MLCRVIIDEVPHKKPIELIEEDVFDQLLIGSAVIVSRQLGYANIVESVIRTVDGADVHLKRIYLQGALN